MMMSKPKPFFRRRIERIFASILMLIVFGSLLIVRPLQQHFRYVVFEDDTIGIWSQHVNAFPVSTEDRYPFGEMGFRAHIYQQLLQSGDITKRLEIEPALWDFVPGVHRLVGSSSTGGSNGSTRLRHSNKTRGIVTTTDESRLRLTIELISTLRLVQNCILPITVFYGAQDELPDLTKDAIGSLPGVQLQPIDEIAMLDHAKLGYTDLEIKRAEAEQAIAMLASPYVETIFIEAGTIFFSDPAILFDHELYHETGTLFFPAASRAQAPDAERFLNYMRQQFDQGRPHAKLAASPYFNHGANFLQDPSVVVVDRSKSTVVTALMLNLWFHTKRVRNNIWHIHFMEALKETLWVAFELAMFPYSFNDHPPGALGLFEGSFDDLPWSPTLCPAHVLHFQNSGLPVEQRGSSVPIWMPDSLKIRPLHRKNLLANAWSNIGHWEQTARGWCLTGANPRSAKEFNLQRILQLSQKEDQVFEQIFRPMLST